MAQIPKYIDISKTFVPVDPNSFPETMTAPNGDSSPEERIPAMAYKGYNFMPTPYGYKSYFGVNKTLNIAVLPSSVDEIFVFQNALLENVLIALTDTGVWIKKGEAAGDWIQVVTYAAPAVNTHFFWSYVIIADKLYIYQQGRPSYWLVDNHLTAGVVLVEKTPNFLNMGYQVGIFRASGRLAFWDVTDTVSWANLDDFTDFEPSLETLAGNASFSDVQGRIITVLSHGEGFIIYSTKSIVYIAQDTANLYQWKPQVILPSTGVQYPRQVAVASPDTTHFAYTTEGLKKIAMARQETIIPEITDFLKDSTVPIYLKVLEGRFLFLEMMNADYIVGKLQHGEQVIPEYTYTFDGSEYTLGDVVIPSEPVDFCPIIDGISNGDYTDIQPGGAKSPTLAPIDAHPTAPNYKPEWTCYIANNGVKEASNIEWGPTPCPTVGPDGKEVNMCPIGVPTIDKLTTNATNKTAVAGKDAYIDGWTMERFMAVQGAIWEAESQALESVVAAITSRAKSVNKVTQDVTSCTAVAAAAPASCSLGRYVTSFTAPKFGYNACSFWLTRYAATAIDLSRKMTNATLCVANTDNDIVGSFAVLAPITQSVPGAAAGIVAPIEGPPDAIAAAALAARVSVYGEETLIISFVGSTISGGSSTPAAGMTVTIGATGTTQTRSVDINGVVTITPGYTTPVGVAQVVASIVCPTGFLPYMAGSTPMCRLSGTFDKTETMNAYNQGVDAPIPPTPETGFCTITGWTYNDTAGKSARMNATTCTSENGGAVTPSNFSVVPSGQSEFNHAPNGGNTALPIDPLTGDVCGQGADGIVIDGETVVWPGSNVIIKASSFLFSLGSYAPLYPTINGAFVYDLNLKKWGKMLLSYKLLLDYSPINSSAKGIVPATVFGILGGVLGTDSKIRLFDTSPLDSYITYGKIGYYRLGNTSIEEVRVDFRVPSVGKVSVDTSLNGSELVPALHVEKAFDHTTSVTLHGAYPGRWVNITISGVYDISYLEYRGFTQGRR